MVGVKLKSGRKPLGIGKVIRISATINPEANELLDLLTKRNGCNKSRIIEIAIRKMWVAEQERDVKIAENEVTEVISGYENHFSY